MIFPVYFDEDLSRRGVEAELLRRGWTILVTRREGNASQPDELQLAWAAERGLAILTSNQGDFARLHQEWMAAGRHHAGVIVVTDQRTSTGDIIRGLERMAERLESLENRIEFLAQWIRAARPPEP